MRVKAALGAWLLIITAAWLAVAPPDLGLWPLVDAQGAASGVWRLRQHTLYVSGLWSIGLMSLIMVLALRLPVLESLLGGMDQVYRLHKWAGIGAVASAVAHWTVKESGGWIRSAWGGAGRVPREAVWAWLADSRGLAKDIGEWALYALLAMVLITLWQRLLPYKRWRIVHRAMPVLYLALVFHVVALTPLALWTLPLGAVLGGMLALGSVAALWSLAGLVGRPRSHAARLERLRVLGDDVESAPLEIVCAMPPSWPGHRAGQFVFARFDRDEGAHPFTIASASGALGCSAHGEPLLRLVVKPLGDYTRTLHRTLRVGQQVHVEGPYGRFDGRGDTNRAQVWVAAGVGVTPFFALLEARQPGALAAEASSVPVRMHYCTRDARRDALLPRLRALCASACPAVELTVHDDAQGQRLAPRDLAAPHRPVDVWFCGPHGLGQALEDHARGSAHWRVHRESFAMR